MDWKEEFISLVPFFFMGKRKEPKEKAGIGERLRLTHVKVLLGDFSSKKSREPKNHSPLFFMGKRKEPKEKAGMGERLRLTHVKVLLGDFSSKKSREPKNHSPQENAPK